MERYFEINENGHNIRCKLCCREPQSIRQLVIFVHGFAGHKDNAAAAKFAQRMITKYKGAALITFDLPCHGDDVKKRLRLTDCLEYLDLVVQYARKQFQPETLYGHATSFGGFVILRYIADHGSPFRRIGLRCPAVNMFDVLTGAIMTEEEQEKLRRGRDVSVGFDRKIPVNAAFLQELQDKDIRKLDFLDYAEDILILHGTADTVVPFAAGETFCADQLIEFIPVPDADHRFRDPRKMDLAIKAILEFFDL